MESFKKDFMDERVTLKRRIPGKCNLTQSFSTVVIQVYIQCRNNFYLQLMFAKLCPDPRERLKEDDLDVVLSPQRRSFGGGCQGNVAPAPHSRRPISPLENKENESLRLGAARRIGSGRIITARVFERDARAEKERERERDLKDKRFRVGFSYLKFRQRWQDLSFFVTVMLIRNVQKVLQYNICVIMTYLVHNSENYNVNLKVFLSECFLRGILVTNVCLVKGEGMILMLKRNLNGSLEDPQASLRLLSSLVLMTKSWKMINESPSVQGRSQSLSKKA